MRPFNFTAIEGDVCTIHPLGIDGKFVAVIRTGDLEVQFRTEGRLGEVCGKYLSVGSRVLISGNLIGAGIVDAKEVNFLRYNKGNYDSEG